MKFQNLPTDIRIYQSNRAYNIGTILKDSFIGFKDSFYLAKQLSSRDIKAKYRQSVFGIIWDIFPVLMSASIWIFLQGSGTINLLETGMAYPVFVIIGTTFWSMITDCLTLTIDSVNSNKSIITKINFPKEALITLGIIKFGLNFTIKFSLIIIVLLVFKINISLSIVFLIPLLLITFLTFLSIGIIITPLGILYHDIGRIIPILMQILMYISPVMYLAPKDGLMKWLMHYNPLYYIITNLRNTLTGQDLTHLGFLSILAIVSIVLFLLSLIIYKIAMPIITERMSS